MSDAATDLASAAGADLEDIVRVAADRAFEVLPHRDRVVIDISVDAARAIPEIGVGGVTNSFSGSVFIALDDTPSGGVATMLETWLPATLAHELHHSSRVRVGTGVGVTLGEKLVSEGLADSFVHELLPDTPVQPGDEVLTPEQRVEIWSEAQPALSVRPFSLEDQQRWFFGAGGDLPRWTGYSLGFDIAQRYLEGDAGRTAAAAVRVGSREILEGYTP